MTWIYNFYLHLFLSQVTVAKSLISILHSSLTYPPNGCLYLLKVLYSLLGWWIWSSATWTSCWGFNSLCTWKKWWKSSIEQIFCTKWTLPTPPFFSSSPIQQYLIWLKVCFKHIVSQNQYPTVTSSSICTYNWSLPYAGCLALSSCGHQLQCFKHYPRSTLFYYNGYATDLLADSPFFWLSCWFASLAILKDIRTILKQRFLITKIQRTVCCPSCFFLYQENTCWMLFEKVTLC